MENDLITQTLESFLRWGASAPTEEIIASLEESKFRDFLNVDSFDFNTLCDQEQFYTSWAMPLYTFNVPALPTLAFRSAVPTPMQAEYSYPMAA
jgi:hypothetical protein